MKKIKVQVRPETTERERGNIRFLGFNENKKGQSSNLIVKRRENYKTRPFLALFNNLCLSGMFFYIFTLCLKYKFFGIN